ncbi:ABC transporter permease, partial [Algoriphagus sp.]
MKQFFTFVKKEFYHVFRDRKTLLMLFGLPIAQIMLFGFALTNEIKDSNIVVVDYVNDAASKEITQKLAASDQFELQSALMSHREIEAAFKKGKINLAVVFPANFNSDLLAQNTAQIQVIADASDPNKANSLTNYVTNIVRDYQLERVNEAPLPYQIQAEIRMLYNPE